MGRCRRENPQRQVGANDRDPQSVGVDGGEDVVDGRQKQKKQEKQRFLAQQRHQQIQMHPR